MDEILKEFAKHDLYPDHLSIDGRIHRFKTHAEDSKSSGWYCGHRIYIKGNENPYFNISFGNHSDPDSPWKFRTGGAELSEKDKALIKKQSDTARKFAEKERDALFEEVAKEVLEKWNSLSDTGESEYLKLKQIENCPNLGVRFDNKTGDIYVPLRDTGGKLWSLQKITSGGVKRFYSGARAKGCFHIIGGERQGSNYVFTEGLATAASVHLAIGNPVVCAFSAPGLDEVGLSFRRSYPEGKFIFAGDEDLKDPGLSAGPNGQPSEFDHGPGRTTDSGRPRRARRNSGRSGAEEAAKNCAGAAHFPRFKNLAPGQFAEKPNKIPSDWNDLHCLEGIEAVRTQLNSTPLSAPVAFDRESIVTAPYPDQNAKGIRRGTFANFRELMRRVDFTIRYNIISKEDEILIPNHSFSRANQANATLAHIMDWCERAQIPYGNLSSYITTLADLNPYNPVATWIESKPWDGVSRFDKFCQTIKARNESDQKIMDMKRTILKRWMISAVAAAFEPNGISAHGILVFRADQNLGKTKWFKSLVPQELELTADGVTLSVKDKDSVLHTIKRWLVELGELDGTLNRSDAAQLKAFITKKEDTIRRAYDRKERNYERRTVFFGSVNDFKFLKDPTGNRRFWTIECEAIEHSHNLDMQQVWAEVLTFYRAGESWFLNNSEMESLNVHNENFTSVDPIEEQILGYMIQNEKNGKLIWLSATEICKTIGIREPKQSDTRSASRVLKKVCGNGAGGREVRVQDGYTKYKFPINPIHAQAHSTVC